MVHSNAADDDDACKALLMAHPPAPARLPPSAKVHSLLSSVIDKARPHWRSDRLHLYTRQHIASNSNLRFLLIVQVAHQFIAFVNDLHEVIQQLLLACPLCVRFFRLCIGSKVGRGRRAKKKETVRMVIVEIVKSTMMMMIINEWGSSN